MNTANGEWSDVGCDLFGRCKRCGKKVETTAGCSCSHGVVIRTEPQEEIKLQTDERSNMERPVVLRGDMIPLISAVALDKYREVANYAMFLEEKIRLFSQKWKACSPYATTQEEVDDYRLALKELVDMGEKFQKIEDLE